MIDWKFQPRWLSVLNSQTVFVLKFTPETTSSQLLVLVFEPVDHDDWEIIELHAEYLEEQLLNQVQVIFLILDYH